MRQTPLTFTVGTAPVSPNTRFAAFFATGGKTSVSSVGGWPALRMNVCFLMAVMVTLGSVSGAANDKTDGRTMLVNTRFDPDEWNREDWIFVKSPRWDYIGDWVQEADHIRNRTPEGLGEDRLIADRYHYAYMSMVRRDPVDTGTEPEISARMSFSHDQGPQIVIAGELGANADGYPEYREHYEVVLFARGVNVWRHVFREGRPEWARVAYAQFPLQAGTAYDLKVRIEAPRRSRNGPSEEGKMVVVSVGEGNHFAFHAPEMPERVYVGITGYASVNRFYRFSLTSREP